MKALTEKTYFSLGLVLVLIGVVVWAVRLEAKVVSHSDLDDRRVEKLEKELSDVQRLFYSIDKRLSRIEDKLGVK